MVTLRRLIKKQNNLRTLNSFLCKLLLIFSVLLIIVSGLSTIFNLKGIFSFILAICDIGTLVTSFLLLRKLKNLKFDIECEIESIIYIAFREAMNDDDFDDELFGLIECVKNTGPNILVTVDIYNKNINFQELFTAILPTVNNMQRLLKKRVDIYSRYN